jgi:hypothetical protein
MKKQIITSEQKNEEDEKREVVEKYIDDSMDLFVTLC